MNNQYYEAILSGEVKGKSEGEVIIARAYRDAKHHGATCPVIEPGTCVFESQVDGIMQSLRDSGTNEFYMASGYSSLLEVLYLLQKAGCELGRIYDIVWGDEYESDKNLRAMLISIPYHVMNKR
ncbi:MAG: hypothetical protein LBL82_07380 [Oscillospiraceae bacterium]|jgi:hypothetical protein|nr:hypothetical protein [Oscillospiraceae bacterium]